MTDRGVTDRVAVDDDALTDMPGVALSDSRLRDVCTSLYTLQSYDRAHDISSVM